MQHSGARQGTTKRHPRARRHPGSRGYDVLSGGGRAEPAERRSNEFWLAALGVISTMVTGVVGTAVTWYSGDQHDKNSFNQEITRTD